MWEGAFKVWEVPKGECYFKGAWENFPRSLHDFSGVKGVLNDLKWVKYYGLR